MQAQGPHQRKHRLLGHLPALLDQDGVNAAVAIATMSNLERLGDRDFEVSLWIGLVEFGLVIEKRRASQTGDT
ncbi:hypothetical protein [Mycolicibacterium sp. NCC-Tsukiji]|uniref:hypothetical protein n=1 Tax=Mycolicibacterium sp. NCC-Tsukiji TaxID=2185272 RepID=UPI0035B5150A